MRSVWSSIGGELVERLVLVAVEQVRAYRADRDAVAEALLDGKISRSAAIIGVHFLADGAVECAALLAIGCAERRAVARQFG